MDRSEVIGKIEEIGVLPVIRAASAKAAAAAIDAIAAGGVTVFEVTMTVPGAVELIAETVERYGGEALVGAGTVMDPGTAAKCIDAGARFVISPTLNLRTIKYCRERGVVVMPGALTPTEIVTAWDAGADLVKVFPADALGGANYLKNLKGPLPHVKIIPTGGVTIENAADLILAGARAVGIGTQLVDHEAIAAGEARVVTERAREMLRRVREAKRAAGALNYDVSG